MQTTAEIAEVRRHVRTARAQGARIGCVPTMGALHAGHLSLVERCRSESDYVCVTIFVNPTQFAPHEDLAKYPRPMEDDLRKCRAAGVDLVFIPDVPSLYPDGYQTWVSVEEVTQPLEGAMRPEHFRGVTTVVTKLFNIVQPDVACFGAKDYQQQATIRRMVRDLDLPVEIVVCPTVREPDGLALSSRNVYLSPEERQSALSLSASLQLAADRLATGATDLRGLEQEMIDLMHAQPGVQVQYTVLADPDSLETLTQLQPRMVGLIAAMVGKTRLIDNREFNLPQPTASPSPR
ncbi:MAG: pantoate--beta-alanine ligase [Planctomycetaceae bacterium]|nr:pantoate--beta-alanine ligase [Planctomycetaceae bacterium]